MYPTCTYIMTKGTLCGSPAMTGHKICYYHSREVARKENFNQARELKNSDHFYKYPAQQEALNPDIIESLEIPSLDDAESVQVALTNVIRAIVSGHISEKRASLTLFGLQIAAANAKRVHLKVYGSDNYAIEDPQPLAPLVTVPLPPAGHSDELIAQAKAERAAKKAVQSVTPSTNCHSDPELVEGEEPASVSELMFIPPNPSNGQGLDGARTEDVTTTPQPVSENYHSERSEEPASSTTSDRAPSNRSGFDRLGGTDETGQNGDKKKLPISPHARERLARAVTRLANKPNSKTFAQHIKLAAALHQGKLDAAEFKKEQKKSNGASR